MAKDVPIERLVIDIVTAEPRLNSWIIQERLRKQYERDLPVEEIDETLAALEQSGKLTSERYCDHDCYSLK